jgi:hypothetical protein
MNKVEPLPGATMPTHRLLDRKPGTNEPAQPWVKHEHTDIRKRFDAMWQDIERQAFMGNVARINARSPK